MKFCPKCEARLKQDSSDKNSTCPKCGYSEKSTKQRKQVTIESKSTIDVLDENEGKETLPTIKIECGKCGHGEAVWWMLQTRSADEPTTQFYRCTKCSYTWRNYA
ncbi:MAG TPA: transcription factor S [Nitrosopumilaceae archaeon]|nr:transcription factor S [Nitrosopumilaceae archaeon]HXV39029.1 transcription factor S [Nitrosopumilaceae archaeon]